MMALVRARELDRADLLALVDGEPAGTGMLAGDPASVTSSQPYVDVRVREGMRRRGVGTALVRELALHARRLGKDGFECAVLKSAAARGRDRLARGAAGADARHVRGRVGGVSGVRRLGRATGRHDAGLARLR